MNAVLLATSLFGSVCLADVPAWTKNASKLDAKHFQTSCNGNGPSVDLARASALKDCKSSAAQVLSRSFSAKSISVETESAAGFHQEVSSAEQFDNLSCEPLKEEVVGSSGFYEVWILCSFPLGKVKVRQVESGALNGQISRTATSTSSPNIVHGEKRTVSLSVVPSCSSVMVIGENPRTIVCKDNPMPIVISPRDSELLIRGDGDHLPSHIELNKKETHDESIQIFLDAI